MISPGTWHFTNEVVVIKCFYLMSILSDFIGKGRAGIGDEMGTSAEWVRDRILRLLLNNHQLMKTVDLRNHSVGQAHQHDDPS